jgi:hypothetical protein
MTASSHFWSFCVRNAHLSNTNQPEMEMRPDDATSVMTTMIADVMGF